MRVEKVFVNIAGGHELASGHVRMNHGAEYAISVSSDFDQPANAEITIDGKLAGAWRIPAYGQIHIERPANAERKFTFYRHGTSEASMIDRVHASVSGVVSVRVIPGRVAARVPDYSMLQDFDARGGGMKSYSGQTGLGAASSQRFGSAREIDLDYDRAITVNLRLICEDGGQSPAPLTDVRSNPVPEAILY